jgi:PAS domain S-box-containing protein
MKKRIIWIGRTPFRVCPSYKNIVLFLALWGTLFWAVGQPAINGSDTKTQQYRAFPDTTMRQGNSSAHKNTANDKALIQSSHTYNELFLQSLLGAIPVAVFYKDREGLYLGCNDVFTEIMGVTSEEIKGKGVFELWPGELAQRYHQADIELMESREHQIYQHTITDKNGKLRPVIFGKQVFYDTHGEVAGLVGAFVDITDQQEASMALVHRTIMFLAGVSLFAILMLILFIRLKLSQKKQRIAELEKREIERNYQDIFDSSSNAIFIHDKDTGKILDVNNRMLTLYGYDDKLKACSLSVSDLSDIENGHDATKIVDAFLTANKSGSNSFEWRARKADGEVFWAQVNLKKIVIRGVERILAEVRDISANKKQTEELESFFSVNLDLLCIADTEGNFIKTNEAWGEILGYTTEDLNKMKFLDFVHPDDLEATLEAIKNLDMGQNILNFTNRYLCKDGSYRYIEWRSHPKGNRIYAPREI